MGLEQRISELRTKSGESFQKLADAVGVSKAHIWQLERGKTDNPSMDLVRRIADHYGVTLSYLVGEDIDASDADPQLARMFRQAQDLGESERRILDDMMKSLLKNMKEKSG